METQTNSPVNPSKFNRRVILLILVALLTGVVGIVIGVLISQAANGNVDQAEQTSSSSSSSSSTGTSVSSATTSSSSLTTTSASVNKYVNTYGNYEITLPAEWFSRCGFAHCGNQPASPTDRMPTFASSSDQAQMPYVQIFADGIIQESWENEKSLFAQQNTSGSTLTEMEVSGLDMLISEKIESPAAGVAYFRKSYHFEMPNKPGVYMSVHTYDEVNKANQSIMLEIVKSVKFL